MSLTFTPVDNKVHNLGDMLFTLYDITGDSSYPALGYAIAANKVGLNGHKLRGMVLQGFPGGAPSSLRGVTFDPTNAKLQYLANSSLSPLVVEEVVTVTSNAGRLARVPGYIISVQGLAGSVTGAFRVIPTGKTPITKQVAVNFVTGALATLSTDAVTSLAITYIPLGVGQFTAANRVVDEAHTFTTGGANLANRAAVIQYAWNDTDTTHLPKLIPVGESPATHEIAIDINNSTATTITPNSAQNTNTGLVTYFKYSTSWISDHSWTDQADIAVTSNAVALNEVLDIATIWIPGFGNVIVGETTSGTTNLQSVIEGPRGTAATNVSTFNPLTGALAFDSGDAYVTIEMPYVLLSGAISNGSPGEVSTGANLSSIVARCMFIAD